MSEDQPEIESSQPVGQTEQSSVLQKRDQKAADHRNWAKLAGIGMGLLTAIIPTDHQVNPDIQTPPEAPLTIHVNRSPFSEIASFKTTNGDLFKPDEQTALFRVIEPFNVAVIGSASDSEIRQLPQVDKARIQTKGDLTYYEIDPQVNRLLINRGKGYRSDLIVTKRQEDSKQGVVVAKRIIGIAPLGFKQVDENDYLRQIGNPQQVLKGHKYWGQDEKVDVFASRGLVLAVRNDHGIGVIDEYAQIDPRKSDGSKMNPPELVKFYNSIFDGELTEDSKAA